KIVSISSMNSDIILALYFHATTYRLACPGTRLFCRWRPNIKHKHGANNFGLRTMLKHCIIAIETPQKDQFTSIVCHYERGTDIGDVLLKKYNTIVEATRLLALGDLNYLSAHNVNAFHKDWGYTWNQVQPVHHKNAESLIAYANS